ncbi:MAG TPA: zf-HC2 domain-containing protein [Crinalium sp.]
MDSSLLNDQGASPPCDAMNNLKRDRFELLSAYLDGEVTAAERRQVDHWLKTDPQVQCLYARLLKLRQGMRTLSVPVPERSPDQVADQVFQKIDHNRRRNVLVWGGAAIAAAFVGIVAHLAPPSYAPAHQMAVEPFDSHDSAISSDALMIALDQPLVEIPKATISAPLDSPSSLANP